MLYADGKAAITMEVFAIGTTYTRPGMAFDDLTQTWRKTGWYVDLKGSGVYGPFKREEIALRVAGFLRRVAG